MKNNVKFKDVCPYYIYSNKKGYEIPLTENGGLPSLRRYGNMDKEEKEFCRNYLKGLKIIFKRAKQLRSFDNQNNNIKEKFKAIRRAIKYDDVAVIGEGKCSLQLTAYVDGSWDYQLV